MRLRVRLFSDLREAAGVEALDLEFSGQTVRELWEHLVARYPELARWTGVRLSAVNLAYADSETTLREGDEVAFFPPVSGG